jgi:tol-pal system protein YbgF
MKIPYFIILTACATATNVYADPPKLLPPVLDNSTYSEAIPAPQSSTTYDEPSNLDKLKADVSELKSKLQEQEDAISHLKHSNEELQKKLTGSNKSSEAVSKHSTGSKPPLLDATAPSAPVKSPTATAAETEKERYQRGSDFLKKADYTQAISEFQGILKNYPAGKYADNAQYWIGVALLNKGDKKDAIVAFDRVARNYPKSEKAPEALFKLGDALLSLKNKAKAKEYFDYVIQNYPGTNGAALAAKKKASAKL